MIYLLEGIIFFEREREEFVLRDFSNYFENCNKYINMKVSKDRNNKKRKKLWMKEKIQKVRNDIEKRPLFTTIIFSRKHGNSLPNNVISL